MDEYDATDESVVQRLRALGEHDVDPDLAARHLTEMGSVRSRPPKRFGRVAVAGAAIVGFLAGSTGLAMAGALPGPAQDVAHDVLAQVNIDVPKNHGQCVRAAAQSIPDTDPAKGQKVSEVAKSDCGKKAKGEKGKGEKGAGGPEASNDACKGPPSWAKKKVAPAEKTRLRAEREAKCGPDDDAGENEEREAEGDKPAAGEKQPSPSTTAKPTTTTTAKTATTSTTAPSTTTTAPSTTTTSESTTTTTGGS